MDFKNLENDIMEVLTGKQHKIDANKNQKIDAHDFELLRKQKQMKEEDKPVDKAHYCATHVEHALYGQGFCITEAHADPDENGDIAWYTVQFTEGVKKVDTKQLNILQAESHMHGKKKMKEEVEPIEELSKTTLASYAKKSSNDARMSGQIAKDFENKSTSYRKPEMKSAAARLSGEYKKRAWKREDGTMKAIDRLAKEEVEFEELDETLIIHNSFTFEMKESYSFGDYLSAAKKLVGEEEAINVANQAFRENDTSIFAEEVSRSDVEDKIKAHEKAGHKVSMPKYMTKNGELHAEYIVTDKDSGIRRKYIHQGSRRMVQNMGTPGKKDQE